MSPDKFLWYPAFSRVSNQPYDLSLFESTLEESTEEDNYSIFTDFNIDSLDYEDEHLFIYIAGNDYIDSLESAKLLEIAEMGGTVFVSSRIRHQVLTDIFEYCLPDEEIDNTISESDILRTKKAKRIRPSTVNNNQDSLPLIFWQYKDEVRRYDWAYFSLEMCEESDYIIEGSFESIGETYINMIKMKWGEGQLILHTNPLTFTNYHFKEEPVYNYVSSIFNQRTVETKIIYYKPEPSRRRVGGGSGSIPESPLKFILNNPSLKWGWYLLLFLSLAFVINNYRRNQRAIPVINLPENESAVYLDVVSKLYQKEGKHMHIIRVQERLLKQFLKNKYGIVSTHQNEPFFKEASKRLDLEPKEVEQFFKTIERAKNNSTLTDKDLFNIDTLIKEFYKKCP